jgi:uncharacterized protein (DUF305 family)
MEHNRMMQRMSYSKFSVMMLISFIVMYGVMFLNVDDGGHVYLSLTRTYMSLLMVSPMAIMKLLMMGKMYPNKKVNTTIIIGAVAIFGLALTGLRTQTPVDDIQYMKAMIPHHSSAIMTSKNANISDPAVKELSQRIINSQEKEIAEMKAMLKRLE